MTGEVPARLNEQIRIFSIAYNLKIGLVSEI